MFFLPPTINILQTSLIAVQAGILLFHFCFSHVSFFPELARGILGFSKISKVLKKILDSLKENLF